MIRPGIPILACLAGLACVGGREQMGAGPGGSGDLDGGPVCAQAEQKVRGCGLLGPGTLRCKEPRGAEELCEARCILGAQCDQLDLFLCERQQTGFSDCIEACEVEDFVCDDGSSIPNSARCDGFADCSDASDEASCAGDRFECASGATVSASGRCDGFPDCADGSDEDDCDGESFVCDDGDEVPSSFECDGEPNCRRGEDERGCPELAEIMCE